MSDLRIHDLPIDRRPRRHTPGAFAKDPHGDGQQTDEDVQAADDAEDLEGTLFGDPGGDKVVHAEGVDVAEVEGGEGLGGLVTVAFGDVAVDTRLIVSGFQKSEDEDDEEGE